MSVEQQIERFCAQLRRRQVSGSNQAAKRTAEVLRLVVTSQKHASASALINDVHQVGLRLQAAKPNELAVGNMVRRVLHIIREEAQTESMERKLEKQDTSQIDKHKIQGLLTRALKQTFSQRNFSLTNLLDRDLFDASTFGDVPLEDVSESGDAESAADTASTARGGRAARKGRGQWDRKPIVIEQLNELIEGLDNVAEEIAERAMEYVHANEVILTAGHSHTTALFLRKAAEKRQFQVVVAEGAPAFQGLPMARQLAEAGIQATVITDAAVFALMARVNKVIMGASVLLANGGVLALAGAHAAALAARRHAVPFVVLVGLHKLSPLFASDPNATLNDLQSPGDIIPYDDVCQHLAAADDAHGTTYADVINPAYDYIPPELISLFVTDIGACTPSYIYRLLTEYYSRQDYVLSNTVLGSLVR